MHFIDTHCHLDDTRYDSDLDLVISNAYALGVREILIPAASPHTLSKAKHISDKYEGVYFAYGLHPCDIDKEADFRESLSRFIDESKCKAIGECGLDYYYLPKIAQEDSQNEADKKMEQIKAIKLAQKALFIEQIELAIEKDLPLIVHIREASNDAYKILSSYKQARGVLHCYNADRILLGLSERFYYGIGGVATFKNARRLLEVLPLIPQNRLLLETDAPYLTPHPYRGERNSPEYIPLICARMGEILGIEAEKIASLTTQNAQNLFNFY
ncbi:TatD family hydrolase [Helicobacter sp. T3_23-1059]